MSEYGMCVEHLVLFATSFFVIVEDILSDVLPAVVVGGDMVNTLLQPFVAPPACVEKNAQQQHWSKDHSGGGSVEVDIRVAD